MFVFQRENGRYPPIWFGDKGEGVMGIKANGISNKLFICWRPAARSFYIEPEDDQWNPLEDLQRPGVNAYVIINSADNRQLNEITNIGLVNKEFNKKRILTAPVLFQGESIWFQLIKKTHAIGGIVEIAHVIYDSYERKSYTLENTGNCLEGSDYKRSRRRIKQNL